MRGVPEPQGRESISCCGDVVVHGRNPAVRMGAVRSALLTYAIAALSCSDSAWHDNPVARGARCAETEGKES